MKAQTGTDSSLVNIQKLINHLTNAINNNNDKMRDINLIEIYIINTNKGKHDNIIDVSLSSKNNGKFLYTKSKVS